MVGQAHLGQAERGRHGDQLGHGVTAVRPARVHVVVRQSDGARRLRRAPPRAASHGAAASPAPIRAALARDGRGPQRPSLARGEDPHEQQPGDEAADVRKEGHIRLSTEAGVSLDELQSKPDAEHDPRRHVEDRKEEEDRDDREHTGARKEHDVGAEHAGDGAAGADGRRRGVDVDGDLQCGRRQSADQVEDEEPEAAHGVLDVVAEDPEEQHVEDDVQPAAVHEHAGKRRQPPRSQVPGGMSTRWVISKGTIPARRRKRLTARPSRPSRLVESESS